MEAIHGIKFDLTKWNTRTLVAAILLAMCYTLSFQVIERLDTATTGGINPWLGIIFMNLWYPIGILFFGLYASLVAFNINPAIAILTGTGPLAPAWFAYNTAYVVAASALANYWFKHKQKDELTFWDMLLFVFVGIAPGNLIMLGLWLYVLQLPPTLSWGMFAFDMVLAIPGALIGYFMVRAVAKSGVAYL